MSSSARDGAGGPQQPVDQAAWRTSRDLAQALLRRSGAGHRGGLLTLAALLALLAVQVRWLVLPAVVTAAAGCYLHLARTWGARVLYPSVAALSAAVGRDRAREVCARFAATCTGTSASVTLEHAFARDVVRQRAMDGIGSCTAGHRPLCRHRPPAVVAAPAMLDVALYTRPVRTAARRVGLLVGSLPGGSEQDGERESERGHATADSRGRVT